MKPFSRGTEQQVRTRPNQRGIRGVQDAITVIDRMVEHPQPASLSV